MLKAIYDIVINEKFPLRSHDLKRRKTKGSAENSLMMKFPKLLIPKLGHLKKVQVPLNIYKELL